MLIYALVGILTGGVAFWVGVRRGKRDLCSETSELRREVEQLRGAEQAFAAETQLRREAFARELQLKQEAHEQERQQLIHSYEEKIILLGESEKKVLAIREQAAAAERRTMEKAQQEIRDQFQRTMAELEKTHQAKIELLKEEFKTISDKILEEKSGKLQSLNQEQLNTLLNPLKDKMTEFRTAVEESKNKGIELNSALREQLGKMMEETGRLGGEARALAKALKGEQKTQGDWGELILESILRNSGLRPGVHYESQQTLRDEDGRTIRNEQSDQLMRPDVIVHYPDGKDVIIDSKVSLTAYVDYCNSADDSARNPALARHLQSVRNHVNELAKKDYSSYLGKKGREAIDFVIMFIPNEGPYSLAMIEDPGLWGEAFKQKVLIVSPVNLMALLRIIQLTWSREEQDRNQQNILDTAAQLLERVYAFYRDFDQVGVFMEKMQNSYHNALRRLKKGERNQSIVNSGEKLKRLGIRTKTNVRLPSQLQEIEESAVGELSFDDLQEEVSSPENSGVDAACREAVESGASGATGHN